MPPAIAMEDDRIKFVVGLGNPGKRYDKTRHNVGFMVLAELAARWQLGEPRKGFSGLYHDMRMGPRRVILLAPMTYMNLSGTSVAEAVGFYKASLDDTLAVLDDMALPLGRLRFRGSGTSGGHKGLADILARLGSDQVPRLRIGIGSPPPPMQGVDFVLTTFGPGERPVMEQAVQSAAEAVENWITHGLSFVMERYNRKGDEPKENES